MKRMLCSAAVLSVAVMLFSSCSTTPPEGGFSRPDRYGDEDRYVRVQEIDGKYWFVRGGEKFIARGVNCVLPADPSKKPDKAKYNVWGLYNNSVEEWAEAACGNLKSWNFNTVAGWSHDYLYEHSGMYHTRVLWLGPWGGLHSNNRLVDVWSDSYVAKLEEEAARRIPQHSTNEYLIGYFANNELPWYGDHGWPTSPDVSLLSLYIKLPALYPGKQRAVAFLKELYGNDYTAFRADWVTDAGSFESLLQSCEIRPARRTHQRAVIAWAGIVAERYLALCADAIHRYDPNHLFLGVRIAGRAYRPVLEACGRYADVISINQYSKNGQLNTAYLDAVADLTSKPIMITEFSWRAMENSSGCRNTVGADVTVQSQQDRADCFRTYVGQALELPYLVGYDWFQYADQPPGGRFDGEDSNYGLLDIHNKPYDVLLQTITELNGQADQLRADSMYVRTVSAADVLVDYKDVTVAGDGQPLPEPIVVTDSTSPWFVWGDHGAGASVAVETLENGKLAIRVHPAGWGCGVSFRSASDATVNDDGSMNIPGGRDLVVRLSTADGFAVAPGINESGSGPVDAQTFSGALGADGEAYSHTAIPVRAGENEYRLPLFELGPATGFGNQRGNSHVDLQAVESVQLYFPGNQPPFEFQLEQIAVE